MQRQKLPTVRLGVGREKAFCYAIAGAALVLQMGMFLPPEDWQLPVPPPVFGIIFLICIIWAQAIPRVQVTYRKSNDEVIVSTTRFLQTDHLTLSKNEVQIGYEIHDIDDRTEHLMFLEVPGRARYRFTEAGAPSKTPKLVNQLVSLEKEFDLPIQGDDFYKMTNR